VARAGPPREFLCAPIVTIPVHTSMRLKLVSCDIFTREICAVVMRSPNTIDVEFLPKGLHDIGSKGMCERLCVALERVNESLYDAILVGYGLCNNGIVGLQARSIPLVIPRAHDCITAFLGSKQRYHDYFVANPGTYFLTSGWVERGEATGELAQLSISRQMGLDQTYNELAEKYGEENATYLWQELSRWQESYRQISYIQMGVEPDDRFEREGRRRAAEKGWHFDFVEGDLAMLQRLVDGHWPDEEFLILRPGNRIIATHDQNIIAAEPVSQH
jgi:hypothetical protein